MGPSVALLFHKPTNRRTKKTVLYEDANDGSSGFGVFTNEPAFAWHLENVKHLEWKKTMARSAVAVPGGFYPDERYLRLHMLKQGLPAPGSYKEKYVRSLNDSTEIQ